MNRIKGKHILITGASAGIGEACARRFAEHGGNLTLIARRHERLAQMKRALESEFSINVTTARLDVRERDAIVAFAREIESNGGVPDILVNNAGLASGMDKLHEGDFEDWDRMIDTNIKGLLNVSRAIIPHMVGRNSGHIVNIGSIAGRIVYPMGNVYNASKFAVRALNEGMNLDLVGTNIRVSTIDPGMVETEFAEVRFHGDKNEAKAVYKGMRVLSAEDVADAVLYVTNAPEHVNVLEMVIMPTAQRSPYVMHREKEQ